MTRVQLGRDICGDLHTAEQREWLVTNGMGGYACGSIAGLLTRRYHGLLVAALNPPLERTLLLTKLDEQIHYAGRLYELQVDRWADGTVTAWGHQLIEHFHLEGSLPVWTFAYGDALLEKRIWMEQGSNTTYIRYTLTQASQPLSLALKALVNYRDHHSHTQSNGWEMLIKPNSQGVEIVAFEGATTFFLVASAALLIPCHNWHQGYLLSMEQYRGLHPFDDHLHAASLDIELVVGQSLTLMATTEPDS